MPRRSRPRSSRILALLTAALGLGLGAAEPAVKGTPQTVVMEAVTFRPVALTVRAGDAVAWVNKDLFSHTVTAPGFDSKIIEAGKSWQHVLKSRGEFPYHCTLHPTMKGTLRVR